MKFFEELINIKPEKSMGIYNTTDEFFCLYLNKISTSENKNILVDEDINNRKQGLIEDEYAQQQKINYIGKEVQDIEQIGNNISEKLYNQTEQIKEMRDNVINMNKDADSSNSLANKIIEQARRNRILAYGSGILVGLIFIMVLIYKFK